MWSLLRDWLRIERRARQEIYFGKKDEQEPQSEDSEQ